MDHQTWHFDRLGENLKVPPAIIPTHLNPVVALHKHVKQHLIYGEYNPANLGMRLHPRNSGGYDVVNPSSGFVYGQIRKTPQFGTESFPIFPPTPQPRQSPTEKEHTS